MKLKDVCFWKKSYDNPKQHIKKQRHYFADKGLSSQSYGFYSSHAWMWDLGHKESWVLKNWCFWTVVLEKTLESPLDCKEIQPVSPKGDQSWIFIGGNWCWGWSSNTLTTWCKDGIIGKRPWCWERVTAGGEGDDRGWEVGWHHQLNGHESEWTPGDGDGQGSLACCSPWDLQESDTTEQLSWNELIDQWNKTENSEEKHSCLWSIDFQ